PLLGAQHARLLHFLARLQRESGDVTQGLEISREARQKLERALTAAPGDPSLQRARLGNREELALCGYLRGGTTRDSIIAEQQRGPKDPKTLAGPRSPRAPRFQAELAASAALLARLLLEGSRPDDALACVDEVLPDHEQFMQDEQDRAKKRAEANKPPAKSD